MIDPKIHTRKQFLQYSSSVIAAGMLSRHLRPMVNSQSEPTDPSTVQTLALRAVDAARNAGAQYADVRLTRTHRQILSGGIRRGDSQVYRDNETLAVGVRAFVNGYWGFAASPYWDADEVVRLAQDAVAAAKQNATGPARAADLGTYPVVTGNWIMPVRVDPFRMTVEDKCTYLADLIATAQQLLPRRARTGGSVDLQGGGVAYTRQERALATTDGTMITQTVYDIDSGCVVVVYNAQNQRVGDAAARGITRAGRGWEMFDDARLLEQLPALVAEAEANAVLSQLPVKPVEVGRYDVVCDAATVAGVLDATLGHATEVDRALGYEANASGTSYLGPDPFTYLGTPVASPLVSVTANRSVVGGLATVQWDEEGVAPQDFPLVSQGTLVDYHTTREQAAWLAPWYATHHQPVRSHGCAGAADASGMTMQMLPNLALTPSASATTLADLIAGTTKGIALFGARTTVDFQSRNGMLRAPGAVMYEIRDGKLVSQLTHGGVLFSSTEFWKNVTALGGATSTEPIALDETKGEPAQTTTHTVSAVPMAVKNMAVVDVTRRA